MACKYCLCPRLTAHPIVRAVFFFLSGAECVLWHRRCVWLRFVRVCRRFAFVLYAEPSSAAAAASAGAAGAVSVSGKAIKVEAHCTLGPHGGGLAGVGRRQV